jgi:hypothetical protein
MVTQMVTQMVTVTRTLKLLPLAPCMDLLFALSPKTLLCCQLVL